MNRKELEEQVQYHNTMLKYAQGHVDHHTKAAKMYSDRLRKLKNKTNEQIATTKTDEILRKLTKT